LAIFAFYAPLFLRLRSLAASLESCVALCRT
jgi:hypothetical protein